MVGMKQKFYFEVITKKIRKKSYRRVKRNHFMDGKRFARILQSSSMKVLTVVE